MDGNPYARIVQVIRGETADQTATAETPLTGLGAAPARMRLGVVASKVPISVNVAGIIIPAACLRINEQLVKGHQEKVRLTSQDSSYSGLTGWLSGPISCPGGLGSPNLSTVTDGTLHSNETAVENAVMEQLELNLSVGDQVLLLTEDDQLFLILCRVVNAV